jgi:tetratricopeptide (TPR) repeat protein
MTPRTRKLSILPMLGALAALSIASAARAAGPVRPILRSTAQGAQAPVQEPVQQDARRALQRGEQLVQKGDFNAAAAEFERASELAGGACPECLLGVARAYSGARQLDAGIHMTRMAIALFDTPTDQARAYSQLGSLLTLKGDTKGAREAFDKAVQLDGSMAAQVRSSLAEALVKRAKLELAAQQEAAQPAVAAEEVIATAHR